MVSTAAAIAIIREPVAEMEAAWATQLGARDFAQLRDLLADLNEVI